MFILCSLGSNLYRIDFDLMWTLWIHFFHISTLLYVLFLCMGMKSQLKECIFKIVLSILVVVKWKFTEMKWNSHVISSNFAFPLKQKFVFHYLIRFNFESSLRCFFLLSSTQNWNVVNQNDDSSCRNMNKKCSFHQGHT